MVGGPGSPCLTSSSVTKFYSRGGRGADVTYKLSLSNTAQMLNIPGVVLTWFTPLFFFLPLNVVATASPLVLLSAGILA